MSWSLANEDGLIDQFATTTGLADLREAAKEEPALVDFFHEGVTKNIELCRQQLAKVARRTKRPDVKSTALGLARMMKGETLVSISNGADYDGEISADVTESLRESEPSKHQAARSTPSSRIAMTSGGC